MVEGLTKLTKVNLGQATREQQQAENVRKMFLAMANDMRVIPIKLTDRLHNLRTLEYCRSEKRVRKARETLEIYAPIAHPPGHGQIKSELEDLAFMNLEPEKYRAIKEQMDEMRTERAASLQEAMERIREKLKEGGIKASINGPPQAPLQHLPQDAEAEHHLQRGVRSHRHPCHRHHGWRNVTPCWA